MISYETYKNLHVFFIIGFFMYVSIIFYDPQFLELKKRKFLVGFLSFLILVAGMGLIARLNFKHSEPFPLWIRLKIINWAIINFLLWGIYKLKTKNYKVLLLICTMLCVWAGIWIAINKPV